MINNKVYFPGLNGVRAIAASIVLIFHIDLASPMFGITPSGIHRGGMAGYGVILFFVLSGYLITSLLIKEKLVFGNIAIKKFYLRRILRIWPLYYLVVIIGVIIMLFEHGNLPHPYSTSLLYYVFFLPNVAFELKIAIITIAPLWSVGVEEQFYALWPWLIKKSKNILLWLIIAIFVYFTIKLFARFFGSAFFYNLVSISAIDCMAIGGIGAYLYASKSKTLSIIYHKYTQLAAWLVLVFSCVYRPLHIFSFIDQELNALFYLVIIMNVSTNPKTIISLENRVFDFLGKISYGIYAYHFIVIYLVSKLIGKRLPDNLFSYLSIYVIISGLTLIIASISYQYYELYFLNKRKRFSAIESSNSRFSN